MSVRAWRTYVCACKDGEGRARGIHNGGAAQEVGDTIADQWQGDGIVDGVHVGFRRLEHGREPALAGGINRIGVARD